MYTYKIVLLISLQIVSFDFVDLLEICPKIFGISACKFH